MGFNTCSFYFGHKGYLMEGIDLSGIEVCPLRELTNQV
jgi:hypothetical protein